MWDFFRGLLGIEKRRMIEIDSIPHQCVTFDNQTDTWAKIIFFEKGDHYPLVHSVPPGRTIRCVKPDTIEIGKQLGVSVEMSGTDCMEIFDCQLCSKKSL